MTNLAYLALLQKFEKNNVIVLEIQCILSKSTNYLCDILILSRYLTMCESIGVLTDTPMPLLEKVKKISM